MSENMNDELVFAFLGDIRKKFIQKYEYEKLASFHAYQLTDFNEILTSLVVRKFIFK